MTILVAMLTSALLLSGTINSTSAPAPRPNLEMKRILELVQKKIPVTLSDWIKNEDKVVSGDVQVYVKLARNISQTETKMTIQYKMSRQTALLDVLQEEIEYLTLYLRYYDNHWTVTAFHSTDTTHNVCRLVLAIDQLSDEPR
jgi:hypothetical protein